MAKNISLILHRIRLGLHREATGKSSGMLREAFGKPREMLANASKSCAPEPRRPCEGPVSAASRPGLCQVKNLRDETKVWVGYRVELRHSLLRNREAFR